MHGSGVMGAWYGAWYFGLALKFIKAYIKKKIVFWGKLQQEVFGRFLGKTSLMKNFLMKSGVGGGGIKIIELILKSLL